MFDVDVLQFQDVFLFGLFDFCGKFWVRIFQVYFGNYDILGFLKENLIFVLCFYV